MGVFKVIRTILSLLGTAKAKTQVGVQHTATHPLLTATATTAGTETRRATRLSSTLCSVVLCTAAVRGLETITVK